MCCRVFSDARELTFVLQQPATARRTCRSERMFHYREIPTYLLGFANLMSLPPRHCRCCSGQCVEVVYYALQERRGHWKSQ